MHSPDEHIQGLRVSNVRSPASMRLNAHPHVSSLRLLYADPTPNALQVFVSQREVLDDAALAPVSASNTSGLAPSAASAVLAQETIKEGDSSDGIPELPKEEGDMPGVWISADPLPGCIVCNIGESECCLCYEPLGMLNITHSVGGLDERAIQKHIAPCHTQRIELSVRQELINFND